MKIALVDRDLSVKTGERRFEYNVAIQLEKLGHEVKILTGRMDRERCFPEFLRLPVEVVSRGESHVERSLKQTVLQVFRKHGQGAMDEFFERTTPSNSNLPPEQKPNSNLLLETADTIQYLMRTILAMDMSKRIADTGCDVAMAQHQGEWGLLPFFYHLSEPTGAVYLNGGLRARGAWASPVTSRFQELPWRRRILDSLLDIPPAGRWNEASFKKLALFLGPSKFLLDQVKGQLVIGQRKAEVVPMGVDHSQFFPTGEEEPYALFIGRIHPQKSLELAILAMKNMDPDKSLIIAGSVGSAGPGILSEDFSWYKEKLIDLAAKMEMSNRVRVIPFPSDSEVVRLMQRCSVFLFPGGDENFGVAMLEAMACGKPVVASNRCALPEVAGDAAFLLEPDARQWQETVRRVFSDSDLRKQMGQKALQRSKAFSWENTTKRLLQVFSNLK
jgi:glycosyltransferase involved in cell wall biosynthesis